MSNLIETLIIFAIIVIVAAVFFGIGGKQAEYDIAFACARGEEVTVDTHTATYHITCEATIAPPETP